jgi:hypothetical protein
MPCSALSVCLEVPDVYPRRGSASGTIVAFIFVGAICFTAGLMLGQWVKFRPSGPLMAPAGAQPEGGGSTPAAIGARFVVTPDTIDFGQIGGGKHDTLVRIDNVGASPLRITAIKADCKCTTVGAHEGTIIEPGASLEIPISMTFSYLPGIRTSRVNVAFDGADSARIDLRGEVTERVQAVPPAANGFAGMTGQTMLRALDGAPFNIRSVDGRPPVYVAESPDGPAVEHLIEWDLTRFGEGCEDEAGNPIRRCIIVETDHPDVALIGLPVRHRCLSDAASGRTWMMLKPYVVVPPSRPGQSIEIEVPGRWLPNRPPGDLPVSIDVGTPGASAAVLGSTEAGERFETRITVDLPADARGLTYVELTLIGATGKQDVEIATVIEEDE